MIRQLAFCLNIFNWFGFRFYILFGEAEPENEHQQNEDENFAENGNHFQDDPPQMAQAIEEGWDDEIDFEDLAPVWF